MSDKDLESLDWNMDSSDVDSDDDDDTCYEFEVKKSQEEQEDFKIYPGFEVFDYMLFIIFIIISN
jgi:hypothetical protein